MRVMYLILNLLYRNDAKSKVVALTLKQIQEILEAEGDKYNIRTVSYKIKELKQDGYIKDGMKEKNANTYYISADGIEWLKQMEEEEGEV